MPFKQQDQSGKRDICVLEWETPALVFLSKTEIHLTSELKDLKDLIYPFILLKNITL